MTRLRLYVLPRLCLGLSVLFFLFALWVLWLSLERPLPTVALACRQAERAGLSSSGTLLASGSAELGQASSHHDRWAVLRYGDGTYALAELDRRVGFCGPCSLTIAVSVPSQSGASGLPHLPHSCLGPRRVLAGRL